MGYLRIKRPGGLVAIPDDALLYYNQTLGEYFLITDEGLEYLVWSEV